MARPANRIVQNVSWSGRILFNKLQLPPSTGSWFSRIPVSYEDLVNRQRRQLVSSICSSPSISGRCLECIESRSSIPVPSRQIPTLMRYVVDTSSSRTSFSYQLEATRRFSSFGRHGKGRAPKAVLANEELIARLVRDADNASSDTINVRLVIDEGPNTSSSVQVTSLTHAVQLSLDRNADLIGSALNNDPPVIRLTDLSKLHFKAEQAQKKQQADASTKKEKKSFRFKAGIDTHDLERKVAQLTGYLQKGHDCEYTVFARARTLRGNENAGVELVDKIQALIADHGIQKRAPETNETKSFSRVQLTPKK
jgi:translation initiation factor IF-3